MRLKSFTGLTLSMPDAFKAYLQTLDHDSDHPSLLYIDFSLLYGPPQIPESSLTLHMSDDNFQSEYPYFVGEDRRSVGEIWSSIRPLIYDRVIGMMDDEVRQFYNSDRDYVGKLVECPVLIAKELILPDRFLEELRENEENIKRRKPLSLHDSVVSGQLFVDLEQGKMFYQRLVRILKEEGAELGKRTWIASPVYASRISLDHTMEVAEILHEELSKHGYESKVNPKIWGYGWGVDGKAKVWLGTLKNSTYRMVGEIVMIEPLLPCGTTHHRRQLEFYEMQERGGQLGCGFIEGLEKCAIGYCPRGARGKIVKKDPNNPTMVPSEVQRLGRAVELIKNHVKELYEAADDLKQNERNYR